MATAPSVPTTAGPAGEPEPLDREFWEAQLDEIGARGLRVLAAAHARPPVGTSTLSHSDLDGGLVLAGLTVAALTLTACGGSLTHGSGGA